MSKRTRFDNDESYSIESRMTQRCDERVDSLPVTLLADGQTPLDEKILAADLNHAIQAPTTNGGTSPNAHTYHLTVCGSLLYSPPSNSPAEIFAYLRHSRFDAFRRSLDVYHAEIIHMRNGQGQVSRAIAREVEGTAPIVFRPYCTFWRFTRFNTCGFDC